MILLLDGLLVGLIIGLLTGGKLSHLRDVSFAHETLFFVALLAHLAWPFLARVFEIDSTQTIVGWVLLALALAGLALMNTRYVGMIVLAVGLLLNVLVVAANGAMPVALDALGEGTVAYEQASEGIESSWLHEPMSAETRLPILGDVLRIPGPSWHRGLASLGDLLMSSGVALVMVQGMRRATHAHDSPDASASPAT